MLYQAVTTGYDLVEVGPKPVLTGVTRELRRANLEPGSRAAMLWNRQHKIVAPPRCGQWSLYLDGSLRPKRAIHLTVNGWLKDHEVAFFRHPNRTCAYDEIDACVMLHKITADDGQKAREALKQFGHPKDFGLWACGVVARRAATELHAIFANVWYPLVKLVPRDQIWLPHVIREHKLLDRVHTVDDDIFKSRWFTYRRHMT